MAFTTGIKNAFSVKAYVGDNKTLLAFNFSDPAKAKNLAGFSIACQPPAGPAYYLWNELQFADPSKHAQVPSEKPRSTVNAPIQKYRWTHVPGTNHQGTSPATGNYTYTVTPRYFDNNKSMTALDRSLSASVTVPVGPFRKGALSIGFTRGYMQSEAFKSHFGAATRVVPANRELIFDTTAEAGTSNGKSIKYSDIYQWMGATARERIFTVLNAVVADPTLHLDVFAYDLDEPDIVGLFLKLAAQGRIRIILDNSSEHVTTSDPKTGKVKVALEDTFTEQFKQKMEAPAEIVRGCFARFSHDKIFIVSKNGAALRVLTGSTNFSVTGLYVNANHVLVFDDAAVAAHYAAVFEQSWTVLKAHPKLSTAAANAFSGTDVATKPFTAQSPTVPKHSITFSPHTADDAAKILDAIVARVEGQTKVAKGNVLFAVMQLTGSNTPVYQELCAIHETQSIYSYGISDAPSGVFLYQPASAKGVLVTGKPGKLTLPAPFDELPTPPGHEIHDKFVVCGLNGADPAVYCGSSNLASGGEAANGDNLLEIHDADVATAFAIEALLLVDHYNFLDRFAAPKTAAPPAAKNAPAKKAKAAKVGRK